MFRMKRDHSGRIVQARAAHVNQIRFSIGTVPWRDCSDLSGRIILSCLTLSTDRTKLSRGIVFPQRVFSTSLPRLRLTV